MEQDNPWIKVVFLVITFLVLIVGIPLLAIACLNVLLPATMSIAYSFKTWLAMLVIVALFGGGNYKSATRDAVG